MCLALREAMAVLPNVASELVPDVLLGISDGGPCATHMATTYAASCDESVAAMHVWCTLYQLCLGGCTSAGYDFYLYDAPTLCHGACAFQVSLRS